MADCNKKLSAALNDDACGANAPKKGFEEIAYIYNRADIDFSAGATTYNVETAICSNLILKGTTKGYPVYFKGENPFTGTKVDMVKKAYANQFDSIFAFNILADSPETAAQVNAIVNGEFVILTEKKGKGLTAPTVGNRKYRIFGLELGLKAETATQDFYSDEAGGGWNITLKETEANSSGMFVYKTDLPTTETMVAATLD